MNVIFKINKNSFPKSKGIGYKTKDEDVVITFRKEGRGGGYGD